MPTYEQEVEAAKGDDGAFLMAQEKEVELWRGRALQRTEQMVSACPNVFTRADARINAEDFSEEGLRKWGFVTAEAQIKSLRDNVEKVLPELEQRARELERTFRSKIEEAMTKQWIGRRSVSRWMGRLAGENALYYQKEQFIAGNPSSDDARNPKTFMGMVNNWQKVAEARANLIREEPLIKVLSAKDVKNLSVFLDVEKFCERPYPERENLLEAVKGALAAKKRQMPDLHAKAKAMLETAARDKAISWNKIGPWMHRIFKSGANAELIEKFISGTQGVSIAGKTMTLPKLITSWQQASTHFRSIENKRSKEGTPRSFHFVKLEVFLNWRFEQQKSYLTEADHSFEDIGPQDEFISKIRHELAAEDWDSAEDLLQNAMQKPLTDGQKSKLQSLQKFLREHRKISPGKHGPEQNPSPQQLIRKLNHMIDTQIPMPLREMYREELADGPQEFWSFTVLMYNRVWCHRHGFYDETKERVMEKQAKDPTRQRVEEGHTQTHEWNVVKGDTACKEAIRDQQGLNKAQITSINPRDAESRHAVRERNRQNCNNRSWWYWTSMIPQGVTYAEHLAVVQGVHPEMKKLARQLGKTGVRFPISGDAVPSSLVAKQSGATHKHAGEMLATMQA